MHLIELSHPVEHGMTTYPGLPGPEISDHLSYDDSHAVYAEGTEFTIGRITMVTNTGTYLDTPAHRHRGGHDLAGLPLERCALLPALVVDGSGVIGTGVLDGLDVAGYAVLFRTGWDRHWRTERYGDVEHPSLGVDTTQRLVDGGAALVGIDSVNIDATSTGERPVHTALLAAGIPIVEHLTGLGSLPTTGARFTATPVAVRGLGTFPVRAFASLD
ncbi:MAG: cyclase family protein [Nocardioides sp.]